jgi:hypothetical protein
MAYEDWWKFFFFSLFYEANLPLLTFLLRMPDLKDEFPELFHNLIKFGLFVNLRSCCVLAPEQLFVHRVQLFQHRLHLFALGFHYCLEVG